MLLRGRVTMLYCGVLALLTSTLISCVRADTCYLPDGSEIGGLRICDPTAPASACCAPGDECTAAGLCKAGNDGDNNWMWRGTCSDQTWESEYCPRFCYNSTTSDKAAKVNFKVMACSEDSYCCAYPNSYYPLAGYSFDCCDDPARAFTAGPASHVAGGTVTTKLFVGFTTVSGYAKISSTTESTSSSSESKSRSSASSETSTSTSTPSSTDSPVLSFAAPSAPRTAASTDAPSTTTATPTNAINAGLATESPPATSSTPSGSSGLSTGASAGIGVGATIGALALIALGVFVGLRFRRREAAGRSTETESQTADKMHEQWGGQTAYYRVSPQDHKVGLNEAGWQLPSEADSIPCGELEGKPVDKPQ